MWQMCLLKLGSSWALINRTDMKKRKTRHVVFSCCRFHLTLDAVMRKSVLPHIRHRKSISYILQWPHRTHGVYFTILICIPSYNPKERRSRKMQILRETPLFLSRSFRISLCKQCLFVALQLVCSELDSWNDENSICEAQTHLKWAQG